MPSAKRSKNMTSRTAFNINPRRGALAGLLLTVACVACTPALGAGAVLRTATTTDPATDAPAGLDLRSLRASYSPSRGTLATTVTMYGNLSRSAVVVVAFGTQTAAGSCDLASGERVAFDAGSGAATWASLDPSAVPGRLLTTRIAVPASTTMSSGLTASTNKNRTWNCATAKVEGSSGAPADMAQTSLSNVIDGLEPPTPASATVLQLDHQYDDVVHRSGRLVPVRVTCLVSSSRRCSGRLTLTQQRTHVKLGRMRFTLPLGASKTIRVPVLMSPGLKRLNVVETLVTASPVRGRSARTVLLVKHAR